MSGGLRHTSMCQQSWQMALDDKFKPPSTWNSLYIPSKLELAAYTIALGKLKFQQGIRVPLSQMLKMNFCLSGKFVFHRQPALWLGLDSKKPKRENAKIHLYRALEGIKIVLAAPVGKWDPHMKPNHVPMHRISQTPEVPPAQKIYNIASQVCDMATFTCLDAFKPIQTGP